MKKWHNDPDGDFSYYDDEPMEKIKDWSEAIEKLYHSYKSKDARLIVETMDDLIVNVEDYSSEQLYLKIKRLADNAEDISKDRCKHIIRKWCVNCWDWLNSYDDCMNHQDPIYKCVKCNEYFEPKEYDKK